VLIVDVLAAIVFVLPHAPVTTADWLRFAALAGCSIAHVELTRSVERVRDVGAKAGPYMDTASVWCFAAVVVLPVPLAAGIVAVIYIWSWVRVHRGHRPAYRWLFSGATVVIASQVAAAMLALGPGPHPGLPVTLAGFGVAVAAGGVRWLVNYALVCGAILMSSPKMRAASVLHNIDERVMEIGALGLGLVAAGVLTFSPILLIGIVAGLMAMHRSFLLTQFRKAARTDTKTGLSTVEWWRQIAEQAFERASGAGTEIAVLVLDLDHFKEINDCHGHVAGDQVLRAIGQALHEEVRESDTVGRWGGEEFVVFLTAVSVNELSSVAERLRRRIQALVVPVTGINGDETVDVTVSVGGALFPAPGIATLDDLLIAADKALYLAKNTGRNQVRLAA
jgi:diguanylate cyclase (GGDEF)-like protein